MHGTWEWVNPRNPKLRNPNLHPGDQALSVTRPALLCQHPTSRSPGLRPGFSQFGCLPLCLCPKNSNPKNPNTRNSSLQPEGQALSLTRLASLRRHPSSGFPGIRLGFSQVGCLSHCMAPEAELALETLTLETLTCILESKYGLSLGRHYIAGIWQVGLLDKGQDSASLTACLLLCLIPETELALKHHNIKTLTLETLTCPLESKHGLSLGLPHFVSIRQVGLL